MEQWRRGREAILEELNRVCDRVGLEFTQGLEVPLSPTTGLIYPAELENKQIVDIVELEDLRNKATRFDELERQNSHLLQQLRSQEATRGDAEEAKVAEIKQLQEENTRLEQSLRDFQNVTTRSEAQQGNHERFRAKPAVDGFTHVARPTLGSSPCSTITTPTPHSSEPPPSAAKHLKAGATSTATAEAYTLLVNKYNRLSENRRAIEATRDEVQEKLRKMTKKFKQFKVWGDQQEQLMASKNDLIQQQEEELQMLRLQVQQLEDGKGHHGSQERNALQDLSQGDSRRNNNHAAVVKESCNKSEGSSFGLLECLNEDGGHGVVQDTQFEALEAHPSSSTDEASSPMRNGPLPALHENLHVEEAEWSDLPVVISSRSVKKRKIKLDEDSSQPGAKIKVELGSSPVGLAALYGIDQSIDLDNIGAKVDTPRKKRRRHRSPQGHPLLSQVAEEGTNTPQIHSTNHSLPGSNLQRSSALGTLNSNKQITPRTPLKRIASETRREASDAALEGLSEDGEMPTARKATHKTPHTDQSILRELLTEPSPPKVVLNPSLIRTSLPLTKPRPGSKLSREVSNAHDAAEPPPSLNNQEDRSRPASGGSNKASAIPRATPIEHPRRFAAQARPLIKPRTALEPRPSSLESSSPESVKRKDGPAKFDMFGKPTATKKHKPGFGKEAELRAKVRERLPRSSDDLNSSAKELSKPPILATPESSNHKAAYRKLDSRQRRPEQSADTPNAKPIRQRPLEQLSLEDFKINPNYNQGYDYAFADVVRRPEDRRCLPGCTKPECCGNTFLAMAASIRDPDRILTLSQEEADDRVLEDYLGSDIYKLRNYSKQQRHRVLLEAIAWDLANKHGRHRHAYERRKSPPGFWNVDFPTTQEHEEGRERSLLYERELVEQRYKEAMRPNGAYRFRDE